MDENSDDWLWLYKILTNGITRVLDKNARKKSNTIFLFVAPSKSYSSISSYKRRIATQATYGSTEIKLVQQQILGWLTNVFWSHSWGIVCDMFHKLRKNGKNSDKKNFSIHFVAVHGDVSLHCVYTTHSLPKLFDLQIKCTCFTAIAHILSISQPFSNLISRFTISGANVVLIDINVMYEHVRVTYKIFQQLFLQILMILAVSAAHHIECI